MKKIGKFIIETKANCVQIRTYCRKHKIANPQAPCYTENLEPDCKHFFICHGMQNPFNVTLKHLF